MMVHWHIEVLGFTVPAQPNPRTVKCQHALVIRRVAAQVNENQSEPITAITGWETCSHEGYKVVGIPSIFITFTV